ncbi:hypothetical protein [Flavobacterium limnophilum]|uniref:hypothetical protein n=1 Tax=Flavobacterium limnophilum TaxID=3003262 RepID=UPI0022ABFA37|nr:hypothetical protein [Flavobacterium limnophilum]
MKTSTKTKSLASKTSLTKDINSVIATSNTIIIITGILSSIILLLVKISWIDINWKIPFIPLMVALQIIFLTSAVKNRYKKI